MKTTRTILSALLGLGALTAINEGHAVAADAWLRYGHVYSLQNGTGNWNGGYLDVNGTGCQGNVHCVSTSTSRDRDAGSGAWRIMPTAGHAFGSIVGSDDRIKLMSLADGFGGWLDTRGGPCGNLRCVSTASTGDRSMGSGTWEIWRPDIYAMDGYHRWLAAFGGYTRLPEGAHVILKNGYDDFKGGFLAAGGTGCLGDAFCVSTSASVAPGVSSTSWRLIEVMSPTFIPNHDTFVQLDGSGPHGSSEHINVKNAGSGSAWTVRKGLIEFPIVPDAVPVSATLSLTPSFFNDTAGATVASFRLWGARATSTCKPRFDEATAVYADFPELRSTSTGVSTSSGCFQDLGTFVVHASDVGQTLQISTPALADFIQGEAADGGYAANFLITRVTNSGSLNTGFASKENTSLPGPRLTVNASQSAVSFGPGTTTELPDGRSQFQGELHVPVRGGGFISFPGSDVQYVLDPWGGIQSISGNVGLPQFVGVAAGLLSAMGGFSSSSVSTMSIGYDTPDAFNSAGLPLRDGTKYLYLRTGVSASAEVSSGNLTVSCEAPGPGQDIMVLDLAAPAIFYYTDRLAQADAWIQDAAVGISNGNTIPFEPDYTDYVSDYLHGFDGNMYVSASFDIPTPIEGVDISVSGAATVRADNTLVQGQRTSFKQLGVNSNVDLSASLGVLGVKWHLGGASFLYDATGSKPYVAVSAQYRPGDSFMNIPLGPAVGATVAGYFTGSDANGHNPSYVVIDGDYSFGNKFLHANINGHAEITKYSGHLSATARFPGAVFNVSGDIYKTYAKFSGSGSFGFDIPYVAEVDTKVTVGFDTRNNEVSLSASAHACWYNPFGSDPCGGVSVSDLHFAADGSIRICVDLGEFGEECKTVEI